MRKGFVIAAVFVISHRSKAYLAFIAVLVVCFLLATNSSLAACDKGTGKATTELGILQTCKPYQAIQG